MVHVGLGIAIYTLLKWMWLHTKLAGLNWIITFNHVIILRYQLVFEVYPFSIILFALIADEKVLKRSDHHLNHWARLQAK